MQKRLLRLRYHQKYVLRRRQPSVSELDSFFFTIFAKQLEIYLFLFSFSVTLAPAIQADRFSVETLTNRTNRGQSTASQASATDAERRISLAFTLNSPITSPLSGQQSIAMDNVKITLQTKKITPICI